MTFYRVVLYARMVFLLLLYTLTTTSIVTQSHIWKFYVLPRTTCHKEESNLNFAPTIRATYTGYGWSSLYAGLFQPNET